MTAFLGPDAITAYIWETFADDHHRALPVTTNLSDDTTDPLYREPIVRNLRARLVPIEPLPTRQPSLASKLA